MFLLLIHLWNLYFENTYVKRLIVDGIVGEFIKSYKTPQFWVNIIRNLQIHLIIENKLLPFTESVYLEEACKLPYPYSNYLAKFLVHEHHCPITKVCILNSLGQQNIELFKFLCSKEIIDAHQTLTILDIITSFNQDNKTTKLNSEDIYYLIHHLHDNSMWINLIFLGKHELASELHLGLPELRPEFTPEQSPELSSGVSPSVIVKHTLSEQKEPNLKEKKTIGSSLNLMSELKLVIGRRKHISLENEE